MSWREIPYDLRRPVNLPQNRFQQTLGIITWSFLGATGVYFVLFHDFGPIEHTFTPIRQRLGIDKYAHPISASMPMPNSMPRYEPVKTRDYHSKAWKREHALERAKGKDEKESIS